MEELNRREFLMASALFTAACASGEHSHLTSPPLTTPTITLPDGATILFQGDSVTAADRSSASEAANFGPSLGNSYPLFIGQHLLYSQAKKQVKCYNRAIGGDTVPALQSRWQTDTIALNPSVLSILVGVNDYLGDKAGYESNLTTLVNNTINALPTVQLVIMEPYAIIPPELAQQYADFADIAAAAARVAKAAGAVFVPLQDMFNQLVVQESTAYWLADGQGAHPTIAGHAAIAQQWLKVAGL
jgi:lysophospholipase L1-like esterase